MINNKSVKSKKFLKYLNKIESKLDQISGNFANQPAIKNITLNIKKDLKNSQEIEDRGFFIGLPTKILDSSKKTRLQICC